MVEFEHRCSVRGHHVYHEIWDAVKGEMLECARKLLNEYNRYSVVVKKDSIFIGHLPRKISRQCSRFFLARWMHNLYNDWEKGLFSRPSTRWFGSSMPTSFCTMLLILFLSTN